jgi:hypothetical protein
VVILVILDLGGGGKVLQVLCTTGIQHLPSGAGHTTMLVQLSQALTSAFLSFERPVMATKHP